MGALCGWHTVKFDSVIAGDHSMHTVLAMDLQSVTVTIKRR